ncbi:kinase-like protein [Aspergillus sclerotioniger CBS 115572]|uniref:non-specific serine/threonine protein kinase n=1 Tax=Aspergillus sclerotioniger CBS 115572 TaxID=1450535 RepID=A0A317X7G4_9EURO|nr:kinase-like protein [Aspergillus sclerotioniger CBS 115572]PWY94543.1 kinase-like protein [Aspergillus sclerotioniger CBS 115572]
MAGIPFPPGITNNDIKGFGSSALAALDPTTNLIIKFPFVTTESTKCDHEREIYERLERSSHPRPPSILNFHGTTPHGILLEYAPHRTLRHYLRDLDTPAPISMILRWADQAAEGLQFLHENGICHGDVDCSKFFVTEDLNVKVGGFTRSTEATSDGLKKDIVDFGSAVYYMVTGYMPYQGLGGEEREEMFRKHEFPDLMDVELKAVIFPCWAGSYEGFGGVVGDVRGYGRFLGVV